MLSKYKASATCYDNYQKGVPLLHQRGGHSSSFLKGTHKITHLVNKFDDWQFNDHYVELTYLPTQNYPSPHGMAMYEMVNRDHLGAFFAGHDSMPSAPEPDFGGGRVKSYIELRDISHTLLHVNRVFSRNVSHYAMCPEHIKSDALMDCRKLCTSDGVKKLFKNASKFQKVAVSKWNVHADKVTLSHFLGLVGMDESASKECGAISLDIALKLGIIVEQPDGSWALSDTWDECRPMIFGDAKTTENMSKFIRDMQGRNLSLTEASVQAEVFLDAMSIMACGNEHAAVNFQSVVYATSI